MDPKAYQQFLELERDHWWFRGRRSVYFGLLRHELDGTRPERVLDLGCGMGGFLDGLTELGSKVYPSDISVESLVRCRERGHPMGVVSSGYRLPYRDGAFDLVCMFDAIEHIPDDHQVMREVARVLAPGGRVFVSVPAYQFLFANNDRVAQHQRRYTRGRLAKVFEQAGLKVERNSHSNIFLFPLILPAVLLAKFLETVFQKEASSDHTNLSWPIPKAVHNLLHGIFAAELPFTRRFDWPVGHSIAALAQKR
ncbi:MAG: methyltransferase domain-containing protein [Planctomycetaceae bacterium]|nr:methyltransferase domain-containing protein [Planctomycetaceae bacterium]